MSLCNKQKLLLPFIFFLCLISVPNIGQQAGIISPYNQAVYAGVCLFILYIFSVMLVKSKIVYSLISLVLFSIGFLLLLVGSINGSWWNLGYTLHAIVIGALFVLSLQQLNMDENDWFRFYYLLCLLAFVQILIGLVQYLDKFGVLYFWTGYFPFKFSGDFIGSLQQKNMYASFLAFGVVVSFWIAYSHFFSKLHFVAKIPVWAVIIVGSFIILISGSRVALIGWVVGCILVGYVIREKLFNTKNANSAVFLVAFTSIVIGSYVLEENSSSALEKFDRIIEGQDVRLLLYYASWELFLSNLWFGVGVGNFETAFKAFISSNLYFSQGELGRHLQVFTHPHNEPLYWLIQIGLVGFLPVLICCILLVVNWWRQGLDKFLLYIGLSFPLLMQTMVSYPLILSSVHYFLLLAFIVFSVKVPGLCVCVNFHKIVISILLSCALLGALWVLYILYVGLMSAFETYYFKHRIFLYEVYPEQEKKGYFKNASNLTLYDELVHNNMENLYLNAIKSNNIYDLKQYLLWYDAVAECKSVPQKYTDYAEFSRKHLGL